MSRKDVCRILMARDSSDGWLQESSDICSGNEERSTKLHEITLTRNFVFVRVISWIVGSFKTLLMAQRTMH